MNEIVENSFLKSIRSDDIKLLELQRKYRSGKIKCEDLTEKELIELSKLYERQIKEKKESNKRRKQNLMEFRKNLNK